MLFNIFIFMMFSEVICLHPVDTPRKYYSLQIRLTSTYDLKIILFFLET